MGAKIILISGQAGAGKTSVAKAFLDTLDNTAYIEADSLTAVNPFKFSKQLNDLGMKNAISLIENFIAAGYQNMIVSGLVRDQNALAQLQNHFAKRADIIFIWLRANKETRMERKQGRARDEADSEKYFEMIDSLIPDVEEFRHKGDDFLAIDTTSKSVQEVVREIISRYSIV